MGFRSVLFGLACASGYRGGARNCTDAAGANTNGVDCASAKEYGLCDTAAPGLWVAGVHGSDVTADSTRDACPAACGHPECPLRCEDSSGTPTVAPYDCATIAGAQLCWYNFPGLFKNGENGADVTTDFAAEACPASCGHAECGGAHVSTPGEFAVALMANVSKDADAYGRPCGMDGMAADGTYAHGAAPCEEGLFCSEATRTCVPKPWDDFTTCAGELGGCEGNVFTRNHCCASCNATCAADEWARPEGSPHQYKVMRYNWPVDAAAALCSLEGGALATLGGADDRAFVRALATNATVDGDLWVGYRKSPFCKYCAYPGGEVPPEPRWAWEGSEGAGAWFLPGLAVEQRLLGYEPPAELAGCTRLSAGGDLSLAVGAKDCGTRYNKALARFVCSKTDPEEEATEEETELARLRSEHAALQNEHAGLQDDYASLAALERQYRAWHQDAALEHQTSARNEAVERWNGGLERANVVVVALAGVAAVAAVACFAWFVCRKDRKPARVTARLDV